MPTIQQALTAPTPGAPLAQVQAFLDFLASKLSADDYKTATDMLNAAVRAGQG